MFSLHMDSSELNSTSHNARLGDGFRVKLTKLAQMYTLEYVRGRFPREEIKYFADVLVRKVGKFYQMATLENCAKDLEGKYFSFRSSFTCPGKFNY